MGMVLFQRERHEKENGGGITEEATFFLIFVQSNELGINGVNLQDQCSMSLNVVHLKIVLKYLTRHNHQT